MSLPTLVCLTTQSTPVTRAASPGFFGEGANYGAGNHHSPRLLHEDERLCSHVLPARPAWLHRLWRHLRTHTPVASRTVSAPRRRGAVLVPAVRALSTGEPQPRRGRGGTRRWPRALRRARPCVTEGTVMSNDFTICVGTIGSGIWRSPDGGETWTRVRPSRYPENDVRALAVHPR